MKSVMQNPINPQKDISMKYLTIALTLLLPGCFTMQPIATGKVDPTTPAIQVETLQVINEANALLASVYDAAAENKSNGVWNDKQKSDCIAIADRYSKQIDDARDLVRRKDFDAAKLKAIATRELVKTLLQQARKGQPPQAVILNQFLLGV